VYGDLDEDGFFIGELNGNRGLVPSNFLQNINQKYNKSSGSYSSKDQNKVIFVCFYIKMFLLLFKFFFK
jgi:hypothetical protein